jgi:hypothetical protein
MTTTEPADEELHTIRLHCKDPDEIGGLIWFSRGENDEDEAYKKLFEFAEYATVELDVRKDFTIAAARFLTVKRQRR